MRQFHCGASVCATHQRNESGSSSRCRMVCGGGIVTCSATARDAARATPAGARVDFWAARRDAGDCHHRNEIALNHRAELRTWEIAREGHRVPRQTVKECKPCCRTTLSTMYPGCTRGLANKRCCRQRQGGALCNCATLLPAADFAVVDDANVRHSLRAEQRNIIAID